MRQISFGRLLGRWLFLMISLPVALLWLRADFDPKQFLGIAGKLAVLFGSLSALAVAFESLQTRHWRQRLQRMENFVGALPATITELPEDGPAEIQRLSRAMRDMSLRVRQGVARASLESSRREAILACMAEGVLAVDSDLKVIFCNEAFSQAFDTRRPVPEGRSLYEVVREPALRDVLERVLRTGSEETDRFQLPSAASKWFEARALPLGSETRRGAVIVLHDITDIQNQEQMRKDFVADVSHELRTPLSAIRGYAETLLDGALDDQENNRKFVEIILSHTIRLSNIASDLLVLSELDSNASLVVNPDRISVLPIIEAAIHSVENAAINRKVTLHREKCQDCFVLGVRFRLEQVLVNLLDNAVKFNRPHGDVIVECGPDGAGKVKISVRDTGIGIPIGDVKRIFERFYRVDKARTRSAGGTGLGLPIVKEVIDRMGGTVTVESVLGRGSTFTIVLDAA